MFSDKIEKVGGWGGGETEPLKIRSTEISQIKIKLFLKN